MRDFSNNKKAQSKSYIKRPRESRKRSLGLQSFGTFRGALVTPHLIKYVKLKECHDKDNIKSQSGINFIQPMAHHDAQKKLEEKLTRVHKTKDEQIHGSQP